MDKHKHNNVTHQAEQVCALAEMIQPRRDFADRLEHDLVNLWDGRRTHPQSVGLQTLRRPTMFRRWAFALLTAAMMVAALLLLPLSRNNQHRGVDEFLPLLPHLAAAESSDTQQLMGSLLAGADLTLSAVLPAAPDAMPVYYVENTSPATIEGIRDWAGQFGFTDPQVYSDSMNPGWVIAKNHDGQQLTFSPGSLWGEIIYQGTSTVGAAGSPPEGGVDLAVAFLRDHHLLPESYDVSVAWHEIEISPKLNGLPVRGRGLVHRIVVNPNLEVLRGSFAPLIFESVHTYPIKSAEEAWDELLKGNGYINLIAWPQETPASPETAAGVNVWLPETVVRDADTPVVVPESPFSIGETVTVTGVLNLVYTQDEKGIPVIKAELTQIPGTEATYSLIASEEVIRSLAPYYHLHVQVLGHVVESFSLVGQAIEITTAQKLWPNERRYQFLGHIELETLGGQTQLVFTECEGQTRYVLTGAELDRVRRQFSADRNMSVPRYEVIGRVRPDATVAGLPVIDVSGLASGGDIALQACYAPYAVPANLAERSQARGYVFPNVFMVEKVELVYFASIAVGEQPLLQPVWLFYVRSWDGASSFTVGVAAVRERYIAAASPRTLVDDEFRPDVLELKDGLVDIWSIFYWSGHKKLNFSATHRCLII